MSANLSTLLFLVASVCFIMALRGLSHPETSQSGNRYGIVGMTIAILTTLMMPNMSNFVPIIIAIAIGGVIGAVIAQKIQMTALPQLVAAFHSLVGLAAVCVAGAAVYAPDAFNILEPSGAIHTTSLLEIGLGTAIGAITFTGSIVAFGKLQGLITGKPLVFIGQHKLNAAIGAGILLLVVLFMIDGNTTLFWALVLASFVIGFLLILPIGGADMPVVVSMLNSYSGWAAAATGFTLQNNALIITGALVGSSGAILSYIMCKGMNRSIFNVILGGLAAIPAPQLQAAAKKPAP